MRFLLARTEEEIEMLTQGNSEIRKAADALYVLSADPEVRAKYEMHEKATRDRISQIAAAERKVRGEWQVVVADRDAVIVDMGAVIADRDAVIVDMNATIADRDAVIASAAAENERLRAQIAELQAKRGG